MPLTEALSTTEIKAMLMTPSLLEVAVNDLTMAVSAPPDAA